MRKQLGVALVASLFVLPLAVMAAEPMPAQDAKGLKDDPLVSRFAGSMIVGGYHEDYNEFALPMGPGENRRTPPKTQTVTGEVDFLFYQLPEQKTSLEVMHNYQQALQRAGFTIVFSCGTGEAPQGCGAESFVRPIYRPLAVRIKGSHLAADPWNNLCVSGGDTRHITAQGTVGGAPTYVSVTVNRGPHGHSPLVAAVAIVRSKPMATGEVLVNAKQIDDALAANGKIALYGIHFDTGSAVIKPESDETLAQMAKALQDQPQLNVYIVGHTDNEGQRMPNMTLSRQRAEAVVHALVSRYKVPAKRLSADGVGPLCPVATNTTEQGRAANRRVEMVAQ